MSNTTVAWLSRIIKALFYVLYVFLCNFCTFYVLYDLVCSKWLEMVIKIYYTFIKKHIIYSAEK